MPHIRPPRSSDSEPSDSKTYLLLAKLHQLSKESVSQSTKQSLSPLKCSHACFKDHVPSVQSISNTHRGKLSLPCTLGRQSEDSGVF